MIRKLIFISRIMIISVTPFLLIRWEEGIEVFDSLSYGIRIYLTLPILFLALIEFIIAFEPIREEPNWSNVYPELKKEVK